MSNYTDVCIYTHVCKSGIMNRALVRKDMGVNEHMRNYPTLQLDTN